MRSSVLDQARRYCERFLLPGERSRATHDLAQLGEEAIPVLEAIFSGEAKNEHGVPYRQLGQCLGCAFVTAGLMGPTAKMLEPCLQAGIRDRHLYAVEAGRSLGSLTDETIRELAGCLTDDGSIAFEAAFALQACGHASHPEVLAAARKDLRARRVLERVAGWQGGV
jgi:hypothetical protein